MFLLVGEAASPNSKATTRTATAAASGENSNDGMAFTALSSSPSRARRSAKVEPGKESTKGSFQ